MRRHFRKPATRHRRLVLLLDVSGSMEPYARALLRFVQAFVTETGQSAVCNCHHHAERRLARWLLTCQDRFARAEFPVTHEFISQMLGMRRATVTGELGKLQTAGLIRATPGRIMLLNRDGLELLACECYRIISGEYRRLLGPDAR